MQSRLQGLFRQFSLLRLLIIFTLAFIGAQFAFFLSKNGSAELLDSLVKSSLSNQLLHPVIILPMVSFVLLQILSYVLWITINWWMARSVSQLFGLKNASTCFLGCVIWLLSAILILGLNSYFYPHSFFAIKLNSFYEAGLFFVGCAYFILVCLTYINAFAYRRQLGLSLFFLAIVGGLFAVQWLTIYFSQPAEVAALDKPNIIMIGLDSLRPDHTNFYGSKKTKTPEIDAFLQSSTVFSNNYTSLARTFPSWVSILTAKHPLHANVRNNLADATTAYQVNSIAKELQKAGYETIYATDEKRFSNITKEFGFDKLIGPKMGVNDFLIGGLTDYPLTNLLVNLPGGNILFPYHYGNRAAAITYEPANFSQLIKLGLHGRKNKPLFLAVHLCLAHWPFIYGRDGQSQQTSYANSYKNVVNEVDKQFGDLVKLLTEQKIMNDKSIVVLLSDHGTTVGLPGDRIIEKANYIGKPERIHYITINKLSTAPPNATTNSQKYYSINTVYGQGTDVLSFKQHHTLLAIKGPTFAHMEINQRTNLLDISPTILDALNLPALQNVDGRSLKPLLIKSKMAAKDETIFWETGDKIGEIETDKISINKVVKKRINSYLINKDTGLLYLSPIPEKALIHNKQRAVIWGDWLLAKMPLEKRDEYVKGSKGKPKKIAVRKKVIKPYYVLVNIKTGKWTIGLDTPFAQKAPVTLLQQKLKDFYGDEL